MRGVQPIACKVVLCVTFVNYVYTLQKLHNTLGSYVLLLTLICKCVAQKPAHSKGCGVMPGKIGCPLSRLWNFINNVYLTVAHSSYSSDSIVFVWVKHPHNLIHVLQCSQIQYILNFNEQEMWMDNFTFKMWFINCMQWPHEHPKIVGFTRKGCNTLQTRHQSIQIKMFWNQMTVNCL